MTKKNKIFLIGDIHLRSQLPYHDYVDGGRDEEKQEVLDFIIEQSKDCQTIVFLGDCFDSKNPSSEIIKEFTDFIERFDSKQKIYILIGNHEYKSERTSSLDYLTKIKDKNWKVIDGIEKIGDLVFCSYQTKQSLEVNDNETGQKKLMKLLPEGKILFAHQAISDSLTSSGQNTNIFNEIVLPKKALEKKYDKIIGGHVHHRSLGEKTLISGSIFTAEVGEVEKYIHKLDEDTLEIESIKLPVRPIIKIEDPTDEDLEKLDKNSIVKIIVTSKKSSSETNELKKKLKKFSAYIYIENIVKERQKLHYGDGEGMLSLSIEELLKIYAKERKVSLDVLLSGFNLIR